MSSLSVDRLSFYHRGNLMPITLTTAYDPGSLDPSQSYTKIKIITFAADVDTGAITMSVARGYDPGGGFVEGKLNRKSFSIMDIPFMTDLLDDQSNPIPGTGHAANPHFTTITGKQTAGVENIYDAVSEELYQWLLDEGHYAGIIDP